MLGETQTLRAGCSKVEPKIFAPPQTPFPGARDGQNLISWRWSLLLRTKVYSAFYPSGVGKCVPAAAGKAKAGIWLIPIVDERVGVQVKLWNPLRTRAIPERFWGDDSLRRGAISSLCTFTFTTIATTTTISGSSSKNSSSSSYSCSNGVGVTYSVNKAVSDEFFG